MKKLLIAISILSIISFLTGCKSLPAVSADSIHYQSSYPIGGSTIDASGVEVTETHVKVGKYVRKSRWWYVTQDIEVKNYVRERAAGEQATIKTP